MVNSYEAVKASVKVNLYSNRDKEGEDRSYSISKIGPNWIELNGYLRLEQDPETNRLENYNSKYDVLEWVNESIEYIRELHEAAKTFSVGEGVHFYVGSDCYAGTVIEVHSNRVVVQDDQDIPYHRDIHTQSQDWDFVRNPNGATTTFYKKKDGYFGPKGSRRGLLFKGRHRHYDPHF
jgi:hypothetical protein